MSLSFASISRWAKSHYPTREKLERNRYIRPFAHLVLRSDLWRFNRRSVPRGVALGLFTGICIPFAHSPIAALTAVLVRANVPVAIATTWTSNPATWLVMFPSAIFISNNLGYHVDAGAVHNLIAHNASLGQWARWLLSSAAPALMLGLFVLAVLVSGVGYLLTSLGWRWWISHKRKGRIARALQARGTAWSA